MWRNGEPDFCGGGQLPRNYREWAARESWIGDKPEEKDGSAPILQGDDARPGHSRPKKLLLTTLLNE